MNIVILDEASQELDDAFEYYEYEQIGLGRRFIESFKNSIELIEDETIFILSIASLHRKPNYWIERVK